MQSPPTLAPEGSDGVPRRRRKPRTQIFPSPSPSPPADSTTGERRRLWRDWSNLPPDLLRLIYTCCTEIEDYVKFRSVCTRWRLAAAPSHLPLQFPWLLLPSNPNDSTTVYRFRSVATGKTYIFDLRDSRGRAIHATAHGWLLMTDHNYSPSLLNPLTGAHFLLPPLMPFIDVCFHYLPELDPDGADWFSSSFRQWYPFNIGGEFAVAFVVSSPLRFLYWRSQNRSWTELKIDMTSRDIHTTGYHAGKFYIIGDDRDVWVCDLGAAEPIPELIPSLRVPTEFDSCYLNVAGDLLLLITIFFSNDGRVDRLDCFKLDKSRWLEVRGIGDWVGDYTVFVDRAHVVVAPAPDETSRERNSVYNGGIHCGTYGAETSLAHQLDVITMPDARNSFPLSENDSSRRQLQSNWFVPSL